MSTIFVSSRQRRAPGGGRTHTGRILRPQHRGHCGLYQRLCSLCRPHQPHQRTMVDVISCHEPCHAAARRPGLMRSLGASRAHVDRGVGPAGGAAAERRSRSRCREDADGISESVIVGSGSAGRTAMDASCCSTITQLAYAPPPGNAATVRSGDPDSGDTGSNQAGSTPLPHCAEQVSPYELNPTKLRRATLLSSSDMTKRLDRMVAAGLIERRADPNDRRGILVRLTRRGRSVIDRALRTHVSNEESLLSGLTAAERRTLEGTLRNSCSSSNNQTRRRDAPAQRLRRRTR